MGRGASDARCTRCTLVTCAVRDPDPRRAQGADPSSHPRRGPRARRRRPWRRSPCARSPSAVGIVPTAFYRHFASLERPRAGPGRRVLRVAAQDDPRRPPGRDGHPTRSSTARSTSWSQRPAPARPLRLHRPRTGGRLARSCARPSGTSWGCSSGSWRPTWRDSRGPGVVPRGPAGALEPDRHPIVATAEQVIHAPTDAEDRIVARARTQLRMVLVGALNWRSRGNGVP